MACSWLTTRIPAPTLSAAAPSVEKKLEGRPVGDGRKLILPRLPTTGSENRKGVKWGKKGREGTRLQGVLLSQPLLPGVEDMG